MVKKLQGNPGLNITVTLYVGTGIMRCDNYVFDLCGGGDRLIIIIRTLNKKSIYVQ